MAVRKLLTFTAEQWDYFTKEKEKSHQKGATAFIMQLLNERK